MTKEPAKSFQDLVVWQKAHQFVLAVYRATADFPPAERDGLSLQFRRAAMAVAVNIAEGYARKSRSDKARYLGVAQSAIEECFYYLILVKDLGYGDHESLALQLAEVRRLLADYTAVILTINFLTSGFTR